MKKYFFVLFSLLIVSFVFGFNVSNVNAQTAQELSAQIQSLLETIKQLQAQVNTGQVTVKPTTGVKPDLVVKDIYVTKDWTDQTGTYPQIKATICNVGNAPVKAPAVPGGVTTQLTIGGVNGLSHIGQSNLAVNACSDAFFVINSNYPNYPIKAGEYKVTAITDTLLSPPLPLYNNVVDELDETNNSLTKLLKIGYGEKPTEIFTENTGSAVLNVDLKVNDSDKPNPVAHKSVVAVTWKSNGSWCNGWGHHIPGVDGQMWADYSLESSGGKKLYATHNVYGYLSPLQISIQCWSKDYQQSVNDTVFLPLLPQNSQPSNNLPPQVSPSPAIDADLNDDKKVNVDDLLIVINKWGVCPPTLAPISGCVGDTDQSGTVDKTDLDNVIKYWTY